VLKDRGADGTLTTYTYAMENHLVAVAGTQSGMLPYDVLGRLSKLVTPTGTTQFHYDGDVLPALPVAVSKEFIARPIRRSARDFRQGA
jgi:hypothetical protein